MAHCTLASSRELGRRGRASTMRQNARRHRVAAREGSWLITASAAVGIEGREGTWRHVEATRPERRSSPLAARPHGRSALHECAFLRGVQLRKLDTAASSSPAAIPWHLRAWCLL